MTTLALVFAAALVIVATACLLVAGFLLLAYLLDLPVTLARKGVRRGR